MKYLIKRLLSAFVAKYLFANKRNKYFKPAKKKKGLKYLLKKKIFD